MLELGPPWIIALCTPVYVCVCTLNVVEGTLCVLLISSVSICQEPSRNRGLRKEVRIPTL